MGARNRIGIGLSYRPARLQAGGIDSLESIPGLLKSLKIRAQHQHAPYLQQTPALQVRLLPTVDETFIHK
jgi:hypothetical protein